MTTSDLQSRLDAVVVGHVEGAGRAVVWRATGAAGESDAVRQAAVLPGGQRFQPEPGWLLRKLPSGRWLLLAGGTQHPDMLDSFGRTGIFHGAGFLASQADMGIALACPDPRALCMELAFLAVEGRMAPSSHLRAAEAAAGKHGAIKPRIIPSRELESPAKDWRGVQEALRNLGMRPFTAPVQVGIRWGQGPITTRKDGTAVAIDGAQDAARHILAAWR